ncbi:MAG: nuclear transport factor 2 family protein [Lysobacterales bacterium]
MTTPDNAASIETALIERFYAAFSALDSDTMQACYANDASFEDPVFDLEGREQIGAMWRMLCETIRDKGRDAWRLEVSGIACKGNTGRAHWEPHYRFSATGRLVHNIVDATFTFKDGLIATHRDTFDFWRWSRQALGPAGAMLGWSPMLRSKVRAQAASNLAAFTARRA